MPEAVAGSRVGLGEESWREPRSHWIEGGEEQAIQNAIILRLWERSESRGGRQASHGRTLTGVERKQFVTHLGTRFQRTVILLSMAELGTQRSAPYVRMGRIRPEASLQFI